MDSIEFDIGIATDVDVEHRERPDRREEALEAKGLLHPPVYVPRSQEELEALLPDYPASDQDCTCQLFASTGKCNCNYKLSFEPSDVEGYTAALEHYGMCIIRNVITEEQGKATAASMFTEVSAEAAAKRKPKLLLDINHPASWENVNWSGKRKFLVESPAFSQEAFDNRTSPVVYDIFKHIFNQTELYCSVDNWGLFRGTKDLRFTREEFEEMQTAKQTSFENYLKFYEKEHPGEPLPPDTRKQCDFNVRDHPDEPGCVLIDRPDWRHNLRPHWDLNPWRWLEERADGEPDLYQGIIALLDCPEPVGGFSCVPGSHKFAIDWCKEHRAPNMKRALTRVPDDDQMLTRMQNIPLRAGEMVIWNSGVVHCNFANYDSNMRIIQFVRMLPTDHISTNKDRYCSTRILPRHPEVLEKLRSGSIRTTELGRKLLGLTEQL